MRAAWALPLLFALAWPAVTQAQDAEEWKRRGDAAMDAGRAAEALEAYERASALSPSPALAYNLGRARLGTQDFAGAIEAFERYLRDAPPELRARTHRLEAVLEELRGKVATLGVDADAPGARVWLRGAALGSAPVAGRRVNPGRAVVRVEAEGRRPFEATVELEPRRHLEIHATLAVIPTNGRLLVEVGPRSASVSIDGAALPPPPLDVPLAPGPHAVVAVAPGHQARRETVSVSRGRVTRLVLTLDPAPRPSPAPPVWLWVGAGALVVGGVLAVVALTHERSPDQGTLGTFHVGR